MQRSRGPRRISTLHALTLMAALAGLLLTPGRGLAQQYLGFYAGGTLPADGNTVARERFLSDLSTEASEDGVTFSGGSASLPETEYDLGFVLGAKAGYWLENLNAPFLGVEVEVSGAFPSISEQNLRMSVSGTANGADGVGTFTAPVDEADLTVINVGFNLLARYPFGRIQPYAGVGVGIFTAFLDDVKLREATTVNVGGTTFTLDAGDFLYKEDKQTEPALQLIGGVKGFISDNVAIYAQYKYVKTELEFQSIQLDYDASNVTAGIEFYFGPGGGVSRPATQAQKYSPWPP